VFDLIYVLTAASSETISVSIYARQELVEFQDVGVGSAAATLVFALIALVTVVYIMTARLHVTAEARA
jgi:trehalose/maltose transport system permease protein